MLFAFDEILRVYDTPEWRNSFNEDLKYHMGYICESTTPEYDKMYFTKMRELLGDARKRCPTVEKKWRAAPVSIIARVIECLADGIYSGRAHADTRIFFLRGDGLVAIDVALVHILPVRLSMVRCQQRSPRPGTMTIEPV
jgi:hypothetical protein